MLRLLLPQTSNPPPLNLQTLSPQMFSLLTSNLKTFNLLIFSLQHSTIAPLPIHPHQLGKSVLGHHHTQHLQWRPRTIPTTSWLHPCSSRTADRFIHPTSLFPRLSGARLSKWPTPSCFRWWNQTTTAMISERQLLRQPSVSTPAKSHKLSNDEIVLPGS